VFHGCTQSLRGGWLWVLVASLALTTVSGNQCYLEDADATCAICWTTTADVTKMAACPNTIHARWVTPLAATMYADVRYSATYELTLDAAAFVPIDQQVKDEAGVSLGEFTVPHANIHSCPTSRGKGDWLEVLLTGSHSAHGARLTRIYERPSASC
jgi:hypothetical protein